MLPQVYKPPQVFTTFNPPAIMATTVRKGAAFMPGMVPPPVTMTTAPHAPAPAAPPTPHHASPPVQPLSSGQPATASTGIPTSVLLDEKELTLAGFTSVGGVAPSQQEPFRADSAGRDVETEAEKERRLYRVGQRAQHGPGQRVGLVLPINRQSGQGSVPRQINHEINPTARRMLSSLSEISWPMNAFASALHIHSRVRAGQSGGM